MALGLAGELWHRRGFTNGSEYWYCDLTGTFAIDIFRHDLAGQGAVSPNRFALPSGGILGDEVS